MLMVILDYHFCLYTTLDLVSVEPRTGKTGYGVCTMVGSAGFKLVMFLYEL